MKIVAAGCLVVGLLAQAPGAGAQTHVLENASLQMIVGDPDNQDPNMPAIVDIPWTGVGGADINASGMLTMPGGLFGVEGGLAAITDPTFSPFAGVELFAVNDVATFSGIETLTGGGIMAVDGTLRICLFAPCDAPFVPAEITTPLTESGTDGVGLGGAPIVVDDLLLDSSARGPCGPRAR